MFDATTLGEGKSIEEAVASIVEPPETETPGEDPEPAVEVEETETEDEVEETEEGDEPESGDEAEEADETDDESQEPDAELHTVTVDGEEQQVSLDDLKRGYSGQAYVQKGMREAAEARNSATAVYGQLQDRLKQVEQVLGYVEQQGLEPMPTPPDASLQQSDPMGFAEETFRYQQAVERRNMQIQQIRQAIGGQSEAEKVALEQYAQEQGRMLIAINPDWGDKQKAEAMLSEMAKSANEHYGFTEEEIGQAVDYRNILVLQDALAYRALQGKTKETEKAVAKKAKVAKSKTRRRRPPRAVQRDKQRAQLKKTGNDSDALGLLVNPDL